jgi:peptide/nickel transport system permease protein
MSEAETRRRSVVRRLLRRPPAVIAGAVVAAFVIMAVGAPHVAPYDPIKQNFLAIRKA